MKHYPTVPLEHWNRAQEIRRSPTQAEKLLWRALRTDQLGVTFRRQHPIGPYIVDFVCLDRKLVIEVDGGGHTEPDQAEYDSVRDDYLASRAFRVRRYFNNDVLKDLKGVVESITEALKE
jgi:5-methyltetrahydrofolate--homocysteine methyltransferase